jgi:hypothetical protein
MIELLKTKYDCHGDRMLESFAPVFLFDGACNFITGKLQETDMPFS